MLGRIEMLGGSTSLSPTRMVVVEEGRNSRESKIEMLSGIEKSTDAWRKKKNRLEFRSFDGFYFFQ